MNETQHSLFAAILGKPNAGKSTFLNQVIGQKVSIVSHKVQTTRTRLHGVYVKDNTQIVFVDTPGIFAAQRSFEKHMVKEAWAGLADVDAVLLLMDAKRGLDEETLGILTRLQNGNVKQPVGLVINKIDLVDKSYLLKLATVLGGYSFISRIFMISALKNDGIEEILSWLSSQAKKEPWPYPDAEVTNQSMRELAAEITREKLFAQLNKELPYSLQVETESWETRGNGGVAIKQLISVEREGQKKIVIGAGGVTLKRVGTQARKELEAILESKVHLELFVRVDKNWKDRAIKG